MAQQNGGAGVGTEEIIVPDAGYDSSLESLNGVGPAGTFADHPELVLAAAFVAGLLFAGLVSRVGR